MRVLREERERAQIFSQKIWSFLFRRRTLISEFIFFFITSSLSQRELTNARKGVRPYPFPNRAHSRGRAQKVETTSQACTTRKVRDLVSPHKTGEQPHPDDDQTRPGSQETQTTDQGRQPWRSVDEATQEEDSYKRQVF